MNDATKICFSYIRFSSKKQERGDSLNRQEPIAARVAKEKGWTLRQDLNASDLGVSGFKGDNIKTLKSIIDAVKAGKIPQGAVMIIEAFDRFSRADIDTAEDVLKDMLRAGLEVFVDRGGHHLTRESLGKPTDRILALLELAAAYEYSAKLSYRMGKAWKQKKANASEGIIITDTVPAWLTVEREGNERKRIVLNDKAYIIKRIFQSYADGKGIRTIMRELNRDQIPTFGKGGQSKGAGWSNTHIRRLLSFRGVMGEYQPCKYVGKSERIPDGPPISDYYPEVVSKALFYRVQERLSKQLKTGGCKRNATNLFTDLIKCKCGSAMHIKRSGGEYGYVSLICSNALRGNGCTYSTIQYNLIEKAVLTVIWSKVIPLLSESNASQEKLDAMQGELKDIQTQTKKWTTLINEASEPPKIAMQQLSMFETKEAALKRSIEVLSATISDNPLTEWRQLPKTIDNRLRLAAILKNEIESIRVDASKRQATLTICDPACQFTMRWDRAKGANKTRKSEANESFWLDNRKFYYLDDVFVWVSPRNIDIQTALTGFKEYQPSKHEQV